MAVPIEPRARPDVPALYWIGLTSAVAILIGFRCRAFDLPLETDECNYAYIGARLLEGHRLYVDAWDHQPFGVFALFAAVIPAFGDAPVVFRVLALTFSIASLLLIAMILRRVCGLRAALLGAVLFALASSDPGTGGEGCNREIYMNTLILAAWYCAIGARRGLPSKETNGASQPHVGIHQPWTFASGLFLAIASTLKPIVAVHWVFLGLWLLIPYRRNTRTSVESLLWFAGGPVVVWTATVVYFAATDRFNDFFEAVFLFNVGYGESGEPFYQRFVRFFKPVHHPFVFQSALPLWMAGGAAFLWLIIQRTRKGAGDSAAVIALLLAGYFATCLSGRFWPHYYYLLIPTAVLAVCVAVSAIATRVRIHGKSAVTLIYLVIPLLLLYTEARHYLSQPLHGITVKRYNFRDFWGRAQGENVAAVTDPTDKVFVYGNDASVYYYSRRYCASRFTMITGLAGEMPGSEKRREILIHELEASLPRVIVVLFDQKPFKEWLDFLEAKYAVAVGVDYHDDHPNDPIMFVFARKDQPIRTIDWNWDRRKLTGSN